jgi:hypothetical protein
VLCAEVVVVRTAFFLLFSLPCWLPVARAAEPDALSIEKNLLDRHMPFGTILDPIFDAPDSDTIVGYTRCGDSAIWTGHYLAAAAFRYKVTGSAEALANASRALDGLTLLTDVTGNNLLARCAVPVTSDFAAGITQEETNNGVYPGIAGDVSYYWIGNTSRDQYLGVFFGLGVAYNYIPDPKFRARVSALGTRLLQFLLDHAWTVVMPDFSISTTFLARPDQQLTLLQIGRHLNSSKFNSTYKSLAGFTAAAVLAPIGLEVTDEHSSYFKFNLDTIDLYHLVTLEDSFFRKFFYKDAYDILRNTTDGHVNAHFNMIDRAVNGTNKTRDANTAVYLDEWLTRPRRDFLVDLRGQLDSCNSDGTLACHPVPIAQRPPTDFLWQRDPFQLMGGGSGRIEGAGIDYMLPYWMARYYGVVKD